MKFEQFSQPRSEGTRSSSSSVERRPVQRRQLQSANAPAMAEVRNETEKRMDEDISNEASIQIEQDQEIDYRGPEKKIEQKREAVILAFEQGKITEQQLGILIEEVSRKSIKDALEIGMQTGYDRAQMLGILGRTANLMHPEDPEYEEDKVIERLRYLSGFTDDTLEPFRSAKAPVSIDRDALSTELGEEGKELLSDLNASYEAYVAWNGKRGRKEVSQVSEYGVGRIMSKEEHDAYKLIKDIEPILKGSIESKKMTQIVESLSIPAEVKAELDGLGQKPTEKKKNLEVEDIPKTYAYVMSFVEKSPLLIEKKRREAEGITSDYEFEKACENENGKISRAAEALIRGYIDQDALIEEARALMELCGLEDSKIKEVLKQKRKKMEATMPLLMQVRADQLEPIKKELEQRLKNPRAFHDALRIRIADIEAMQLALRKGEIMPDSLGSGFTVGSRSVGERFSDRTKKEAHKINFPEGFNQGLSELNPVLPGYTFVAKNDTYTHKEYGTYQQYLFPPKDATEYGQRQEESRMNEQGQKSEEEYEKEQGGMQQRFFEPIDIDENIDGDPSMKFPDKLLELSRPLDTMMVQGVFDEYDAIERVWRMKQGIPVSNSERRREPVIAKIPVTGTHARLPIPLYAQIPLDRVTGVDASGQPIPVHVFLDDKGFVQVEIPKEAGIVEIMYQVEAPEESPGLDAISQKEYQLWKKSLKEKRDEKELLDLKKSLPPECTNFLKSIEKDAPRERVIKIENFVRNIGFYDFKNKETFGLKRQVSLARRLEVMRSRMDELRERHPSVSETKLIAGVCTDFQELTTAMLQVSGLQAGRLSGLRVAGEGATMADSHALSYVEWPEKNGERQLIPVDGTPMAALIPEEKEKLQRMRRSTIRSDEQKKTEKEPAELASRGEDKVLSEKKNEKVKEKNAEALPKSEAMTEGAEKEKTFGEELDEMLAPEEKQQLQNIRDVLMYSPLKQLGSAWLNDPSNQPQLRSLLTSAIKEAGHPSIKIQGIDLQRMWNNLLVDWSGSNASVKREDLERILSSISDDISENSQNALHRLTEQK